jgi:hypothetical protein
LYRTDPQVEVQIKILLKEAAIVSKMQTPAITLSFLANPDWAHGLFLVIL